MPQIMAICEWWSSSFLPGACWWLHSTLYQYLNVKNSFDFIMYLPTSLPATFNTILITTIYFVQTCPNLSKLISQNVAFNYEYGQKPQFGQSKSKIFWTCFDLDLDQCALNAISIFQKNVSKMLVVQQTISEAAIICKYTFNWVRMRGGHLSLWISLNIKSNHLVNILIH